MRSYLKNVNKQWNYITPLELHKEIRKNPNKYYLLDLRRPSDYAKKHIPYSKNIFWRYILKKENLRKLPKNKKIVLICYVGHTSSQILVILRMLGYDVISLKFGMGVSPDKRVYIKGWNDYNLPTRSSNN